MKRLSPAGEGVCTPGVSQRQRVAMCAFPFARHMLATGFVRPLSTRDESAEFLFRHLS
jgi:hypothetical protein